MFRTALCAGCAAFCLSAFSAQAQIGDLASTDDGSRLYFSTTMRLTPDEYSSPKIFEYANGAYGLIAQVAPTAKLQDGSVFQFGYAKPNVSGDGAVLAYDGVASCSGGASCKGAFTAQGFVIGEQLPPAMTTVGSLRVSHNGRFSITFGGTPPNVPPGPPLLYDAQTSTLKVLVAMSVIGDGRQSIADDGTVVTAQGLWKEGTVRPPRLDGPILAARISANGATLVTESLATSECLGDLAFGYCVVTSVVTALDVSTGVGRQLATGPSFDVGQSQLRFGPPVPSQLLPSVSSDGTRVLYLATDPQKHLQAFLFSADDGSVRGLTRGPSGVVDAVLSGDGQHAFVSTQTGELFDVAIAARSLRVQLPSFSGTAEPRRMTPRPHR